MTSIPQVSLAADYTIPRLIKGGWQLAGGHGDVHPDVAIADMTAFADAGMTAFDCADIYTGVEELIGRFIRHWSNVRGSDAARIRVHTKCVPDLDELPTLTRAGIERIVDRSLRRLGTERLDLVQLHWWDYDVPGSVDAALLLRDQQQAGKIHHLGITNFDAEHVLEMLDADVPLVSHQVQLSLLDSRAIRTLSTLASERGIRLLAYGALAGGFLHERWLDAPEPALPLENRSLVKYRLIIDEFGGWAAFQSLLTTVNRIATGHGTTIGAVALAHVLGQPPVGAVIVGARSTAHLAPTIDATMLELDEEESAALTVLIEAAPGPAGDVYALERDKRGPHAAIMRYNLNTT